MGLFTQLGCKGPHTARGTTSGPHRQTQSHRAWTYGTHRCACSTHFQSFKHTEAQAYITLHNTCLQLQLTHKERVYGQPKARLYPGSRRVTQKNDTVVQHRSADSPNKTNSVWCQAGQWPNKLGNVRSLGKYRQGSGCRDHGHIPGICRAHQEPHTRPQNNSKGRHRHILQTPRDTRPCPALLLVPIHLPPDT